MSTPANPKARVVEIIRDHLEGIGIPMEMFDSLADRLDQAGLLAPEWVSVTVPAEDGFYLALNNKEGRIFDWPFDVYGGWPSYVTHYMARPKPPRK